MDINAVVSAGSDEAKALIAAIAAVKAKNESVLLEVKDVALDPAVDSAMIALIKAVLGL